MKTFGDLNIQRGNSCRKIFTGSVTSENFSEPVCANRLNAVIGCNLDKSSFPKFFEIRTRIHLVKCTATCNDLNIKSFYV